MTKIAIAARYADDTPYGHGRLTIRLVDGGSGAALPGGLAVVPVRNVNLDADGEAIVDLTPNGDITDPVGTFYAITVNDSTPTVVRYIEVPAPNGSGDMEVPYAWDDETIQRLAVNPPTSIPAPGSGTVGEVLTLVDDGDGKRYELAPPGNTLPTQTGNSGKFLTTDGTTASWGDVTATIDGYLHADVAFRPVDTSGTYPASDIDPIADTAAWVSAGGPAFFNVTPGDRVAVNNYNFDPTTTGIYDWDGTTFARAADVATVAQFDKKIIVSHVHHSHFTGAPLTTPIPIAVMFFADDPDGEMGEVSWLGKIFMDFESVGEAAPLLVSAGGGVLTGDSRLSDARTPTGHKTSHATGGGDALAPSDIGAVPTSRQIAGQALSSDITAATLRTALALGTAYPLDSDTDAALAAASDSKVATQKATKSYVDARFPIHRSATTSRRISTKGSFNTGAAEGMTTTGDRVYAPIFLPARTYNTLSVRSTTAGTSTWRLGIFNGASGDPTRPGTVLKDAGTIDLSVTAAMLTLSSLNFTIPADGWYWCCAQVETYTSAPQLVCAFADAKTDLLFPGWPGQEGNYLRAYCGYQDLSPSAGALTTANAITGNALTGLDYAGNVPRFWVGP